MFNDGNDEIFMNEDMVMMFLGLMSLWGFVWWFIWFWIFGGSSDGAILNLFVNLSVG